MNRNHYLRLLVGLFVLQSLSHAVSAWSKAPLSLGDVFSLRYASEPIVGPRGERVYYLLNHMDIQKDKRRSNLWWASSDGSTRRPLTSGPRNISSPALSPEGNRIAYVSSDDHRKRLLLRWLDDGAVAEVLSGKETPKALSWSPDGRWLAFTMRVAVEAPTMGTLPAAPEGAEWAPPPEVVDRVVYRNDGAGDRPRAFYQVFIVPADGGATRQLTEGPYDHDSAIAWAPDGSAIYLSANRNDDRAMDVTNTDIHRVDIASGEIHRLTSSSGPEAEVAVSPDGEQLAFTGWDDEGWSYQRSHLYLMDSDGGGRRELLADLDRSVQNPQWSADGGTLYFQFDDQGDTILASTDLRGRMKRLASGLGGLSLGRPYSGASFDLGGGDRYAFTAGNTQRPADIATGRRGRDMTMLTQLNDALLSQRQLADVEEFWVDSSVDGEKIHAWLALPPGFDAGKRYPLILEIHGGPHTNYGGRFSTEVQLYAAAGYAVLYVNPRGSTSYGERFGNLIHHNYPNEDYDDLMSAVDAVLARGFIDESRLYVTGGSGGGVLTAWIVGKTDRFRAAVVAKPVINWTSFSLTADNAPYFTQYWFPQMPWEDPMHYWKRSPLSLVGNVSTPTMLLTGEADLRTPISESEQYYQALKLRGVDTVMVRLPGASHSIATRPSQLMAKVASILEWFARHADDD